METQVRKRSGAVQWTHAAPTADAHLDEAADAAAPEISPAPAAPLQELVGSMFSSPKELRHLAERELGELFVPVELLAESEHCAVFTLHPGSLAPLLVHAERARHWFPFHVTRVEAALVPNRGTGDGTPGTDGSGTDGSGTEGRARLPHLYGAPRPAVDWL